MILKVKVSTKNQVVIPSAMRKKLGIKSGDILLLDVHDGSAFLMPEPRSYSEHFLGLGREVWEGVDVDEYLRQERGGCEKE